MATSIEKYIGKRATLDARPLAAVSLVDVDQVVVIPVYAEEGYLLDTLTSLGANDALGRERTLVICVVNNRDDDPDAIKQENQRTLADLHVAMREPRHGLRLAIVDAASPGCEIPTREGVGTARKIGLDWGAAILASTGATRGVLLCLDADTVVEPNYLAAVRAHYEHHNAWAAVTDYAHPLDSPAIVEYEIFLRYHALGLRYAESPYWRTALGPRITCSVEAYAAVGGMNRRCAGEDFYFLQELIKTGPVTDIATTCTHPSGRPSDRVPFGTGPRVREAEGANAARVRLQHPQVYRILRAWLATVPANVDASAPVLLDLGRTIHPALAAFLRANAFEKTWDGLCTTHPTPARRVREFHRWFDGLKTMRLIHALRDSAFPCQDAATALPLLAPDCGLDGNAIAQALTHDPADVLMLLRSNESPGPTSIAK